MSDKTGIEWTDATWNPFAGCSIVSPGCTNCYAMTMAARIERMGTAPHYAGLTQPSKAGPVWSGKLALAGERQMTQPLRWTSPRKIFVNSMSDLFHEAAPDDWIDRVFAIMALCPQHTFQILTKRPERMRAYIKGKKFAVPILGALPLERVHLEAAAHMEGDGGIWDILKEAGNVYSLYCSVPWPLPNVWLGVSTERQQEAEERIPILLDTPAAVRFISAEPLLGPLDLSALPLAGANTGIGQRKPVGDFTLGEWDAFEQGDLTLQPTTDALRPLTDEIPRIDWVIVGGESGPKARPMHPDWVRSLRDQCTTAGVPFFFKQWGEWAPNENTTDRRGGVVDTAHFFDNRWLFDLYRVGKRFTARLLDGVEHNAFPQR